ncbi:hypothetical protein [Mycobacterium sp. MMS18-G62]
MARTIHVRRALLSTGTALAATAVAFGGAATAPVAVAEPNNGGGTWDIERYEDCLKKYNPGQGGSLEDIDSRLKWCCEDSGGVWKGDGGCVAPSGNSVGTRQIPSGIETAPVVTQAPPLPIKPQIPGDMPAVTLAPACPPDSSDPSCQTS